MSFFETSLTMIQKPGKKKKMTQETTDQYFVCYTHKNPQQHIRKPNLKY